MLKEILTYILGFIIMVGLALGMIVLIYQFLCGIFYDDHKGMPGEDLPF